MAKKPLKKKKSSFKLTDVRITGENKAAHDVQEESVDPTPSETFLAAMGKVPETSVKAFFEEKLKRNDVSTYGEARAWAEATVTETNLDFLLKEMAEFIDDRAKLLATDSEEETSIDSGEESNGSAHQTSDPMGDELSSSGKQDGDDSPNEPLPDGEGWGELPPDLQAQLDSMNLDGMSDEFSEGFEEAREELKKRFEAAQAFVQMLLDRLSALENNDKFHKERGDDHDDRIVKLEKFKVDQTKFDEAQRDINDAVQEKLAKIKVTEQVNQVIHIVQPSGDTVVLDDVVAEQFSDIMELAQARMNIYLYGPTGSGKSHIAHQVANALGLEFYAQSCSEGMNESVFMGMLLPSDGGAYKYRPSKFVEMFENGGIYCIDEIENADSNLLVYPNTALSNGSLYLELDNGRMVKRHKDFICIATGNTTGHGGDMDYLRNELDVSTLRRFKTGMVEIPYSERVEEQLVNSSVLKWGRIARSVISDLGIERNPVSTGTLIEFTKMASGFGWKRKRWEKAFSEGMSTGDRVSFSKKITAYIKKEQEDLRRSIEVEEENSDAISY